MPDDNIQNIQNFIYLIRGQKVMLDRDLATLYNVRTHHLNEAVKRNRNRFPPDFMFQLSAAEHQTLISQIAISKVGRGGSRYAPHAFTEQGIAMLSSVLKSERAIEVNIQIMRAFVKLRELMQSHKNLWDKIKKMEDQYDQQFKIVFDAIRQLIVHEEKPRRKIGFHER